MLAHKIAFVNHIVKQKQTFFSLGKLLAFKYIAAANDEEKISSCNQQEINHNTLWILIQNLSAEQTSETEIPSERNLLAYCFLDLVELLVTKTSFFPCTNKVSHEAVTNTVSETKSIKPTAISLNRNLKE